MRKIGDVVWTAGLDRTEFRETCPDCLGTKAVTLLLESGVRESLECKTCYPGGYEPSRGYLIFNQYRPTARQRTITGIEASAEKVVYKFDGWWGDGLFDTEAEALAHGETLAKKQADDDHERFLHKKEDSRRSWAWESQYHRNNIRRLKQEMGWAEARLNVAKAKAKEPVGVSA